MKQAFVRDRLTWLAYGLLAYNSYFISSLGPMVPFLRSELALDYTLSGLHLSAFSGGVLCVALLSDRLARRFPRRTLLWGSGTLAAIFTLLLIAVRTVWLTLPSIFGIGLGAGVLLIMVQAVLAEHHGPQQARALLEANVIASLSGSCAPLLIGGAQRIGFSWRIALLLAVLYFGVVFTSFRRVPIANSASSSPSSSDHGRLPRLFWFYWLVIFLCVSIEWCIMFWAATFLTSVVDLAPSAAATAVSLFLVAMLVGRFVGSLLTDRIAAPRLLAIALGIVALGFPLFWLAPAVALNLIGLFVTGLGVANLYPLSLAIAMGTAPEHANRASARATLGSSLALLLLPFALGSLADQIGIFRAFGVVVVLVIGALSVLFLAHRSSVSGATAAQGVTPTVV